MVPMDVISSISYSEVLQLHENKNSDLTFFFKQKKEYSKGEKEPEVDLEPIVDITLIGTGNEVLALDSMEDYEFSGFEI